MELGLQWQAAQVFPGLPSEVVWEVVGRVGDRGADCTVSQQAGLGSASLREIKGD